MEVANFGLIGIGAAFALAAIGSAFGMGAAGQAAVGGWKKNFVQNKPAPFLLVAFVGAPLTQTLYGWLLMGAMITNAATTDPWALLAIGIIGGAAMGFSAFFQGKAGAAAADALAETGKGFLNFIVVLGLIESVALLVMIFIQGALVL